MLSDIEYQPDVLRNGAHGGHRHAAIEPVDGIDLGD